MEKSLKKRSKRNSDTHEVKLKKKSTRKSSLEGSVEDEMMKHKRDRDGHASSGESSHHKFTSDDSSDDEVTNDKSDEENSSEEESADETPIDKEFVKLRQELSELSFEELQKLKEKVGIKQFNEIFYGASKVKRKSDVGKKIFKRENKNRPMEMSSKKPVPRFKAVVPIKKEVRRDPRFDDLSGSYNETIFQQTYGFLGDVKQKEKQKLLKQLKKEKDPVKKQKLQSLVARLTHQEKVEMEKQEKKARDKKLRTEEKEMVQQGKKPFYWKKSEKRKLELAEKFRELKKSGKVESYLGKKRKRTAARERKKLPNKPQF